MSEAIPAGLAPVDREPVYRHNFVAFLMDGIFFGVAMNLLGANTTVPDFVRHLTHSEILIGFSGNMWDILWTLPQLLIARYIVRFERKKWWFVGPNLPVRFAVLAFAALTITILKDRPNAILIAFLVCYGLAAFGDGLVGVPWADLTGTSLDERWRARMFGLMTAIVGVVMLGIAPLIGVILGSAGPGFPVSYAFLFGVAGSFFILSNVPTLFIHELPGGKAAEKIPSLNEFLPFLGQVLKTDAPFRSVVIVRLLTTLFAMAGPFYIGFATVRLGLSSSVAVPNLLIMQTIGSVAGALIYTWLGARDNLLFMRLALVGAALLPISALSTVWFGPAPLYFGYVMSGLTLSNLFLCYQNWVVTHANADQRPVYAGLFNTLSAAVSIASPFIAGTIVQTLGYEPLFVVALVIILAAVFVALRFVRK